MNSWFMKSGLAFGLVLASCGAGDAQQNAAKGSSVCTIAQAMRPMATEVRETSGLARGRTNSDVLWTHTDSGNEPQLYALAADGTIRTRVQLPNLEVRDWEDIEAGNCGSENCLYLADIGDNAAVRRQISIYEVVEPALEARAVQVKRVINASYPDGAQDAEALFRLPDGTIYIVTKGRQRTISLYRLSEGGANNQHTLQRVREIAPRPRAETDRVTAATASPNGQWVAIRSYSTLFLYRTTDLLGDGAPAITHSLTSLAEKQGESISLDDDGTIWLTSEAERSQDEPTLTGLRCDLSSLN